MRSPTLFFFIFLFLIHSSIVNAQHLKKNGTPDKRYKENKPTGTTRSASKPSTKNNSITKTSHAKATNPAIKRDKNGKIARCESDKREFMKKSGYPHGRLGYVIDHIKPLKKGGCDCPENMQWQTVEEAKKKDKVEMP